jgi:YfiH family protein
MTLPSIPDSFRWTQEPWGPALRCGPLEATAPHFFSTRQLPLSTSSDWHRVAQTIGVDRVVTLNQVHGRQVIAVKRGESMPATRPDADIVISDNPEAAIAVRAADCVPLLIGDPRSGAVAAVHAGWRGTAAGAATAAVEALAREFGAEAGDLVAAIGPSIGVCCYEVGPELVDAFLAAGHPSDQVHRWFMTPAGARKPRLDTWAANRDQLMLAGVAEENIHTCGLCTASHLELFPSFRAEKEKTGRLAAVIRAKR